MEEKHESSHPKKSNEKEESKKKVIDEEEVKRHAKKSTASVGSSEGEHSSKKNRSKERSKIQKRFKMASSVLLTAINKNKKKKSLTSDSDDPENQSSDINNSGDFPSLLPDIPEFKVQSRSNDMCQEIMEEYRQEAFELIMERLTRREKDSIINELRNTWLRIVEAEWMDDAQISEDESPLSYIVQNTQAEPPLPVTQDFWCRGALETFPNSKRESLMDPFIRESISKLGGGDAFDISSVSSSQQFEKMESNPDIPILTSMKSNSDELIEETPSLISNILGTEDTEISDILGSIPSASKIEKVLSSLEIGSELLESTFQDESLVVSSSNSVTNFLEKEVEVLLHSVTIKPSRSYEYQKYGLKPWTISQCGGRDGSNGVYRLIKQTTSEALVKAIENLANPDSTWKMDQEKEDLHLSLQEIKSEMHIDPSDSHVKMLYVNQSQENHEEQKMTNEVLTQPLEVEDINSDEPKEIKESTEQQFFDQAYVFKRQLKILKRITSVNDGIDSNKERVPRVPSLPNVQPVQDNNIKSIRKNIKKSSKNNPKILKTKILKPSEYATDNTFQNKVDNNKATRQEDNRLMTERLKVSIIRNQMIKNQRNNVRKRLAQE